MLYYDQNLILNLREEEFNIPKIGKKLMSLYKVAWFLIFLTLVWQ